MRYPHLLGLLYHVVSEPVALVPPRAHVPGIAWLHEQCKGEDVVVQYVTTTRMAADIYTKGFTDKVKWVNLCQQVSVVEPRVLDTRELYLLLEMDDPSFSKNGKPSPVTSINSPT